MRRLSKLLKSVFSCCCSGKDSSCCSAGVRVDSDGKIREQVKKNYADLISSSKTGSCCPSATDSKRLHKGIANLAGYAEDELKDLPRELLGTVFACGNPLALTEIKEGETVLDIGSGAGLDVLLAARKVGKEGKVIGLDITPEMIEKGRENARKAGATNVEFRLGDAENMPVEDESVDWIISNCVINLAPDKGKAFQEAYRVLRSGGKLMISDIVSHGLPKEVQDNLTAWTGCIAGALEEGEYLAKIREAGFDGVEVLSRTTYDESAIDSLIGCCSPDSSHPLLEQLSQLKPGIAGKISSVSIKATKGDKT